MTQLKSQETRGTTDGNLGRERQSRLSGLVDFCHCGRRGARDRVYSTISPSSDTQTTGVSTDKISHPTSMRSPKTFPSPSWSIDRKRSGRDKYDCNRYSVPYQKIYHRFLPIHQPKRYLSEWGKAVTGVTGMRDHAHLATILRSSVTRCRGRSRSSVSPTKPIRSGGCGF